MANDEGKTCCVRGRLPRISRISLPGDCVDLCCSSSCSSRSSSSCEMSHSGEHRPRAVVVRRKTRRRVIVKCVPSSSSPVRRVKRSPLVQDLNVPLSSSLLTAESAEDDVLGMSAPSSRRGSSLLQFRKYSFQATLPVGLLSIDGGGGGGMGSARRRLSNVSDAVTRKLSTIGWRMQAVPPQEIIQIGRSLCSQYIRSRLKRSGFLNKKCGLQRLRSAVSLPGGPVFREVFPELLGLGSELERLHPKLYYNVGRQASSAPGGRFTTEKEAGTVLTAVSRELLKQDITWGKVVSLYAVAGGLAVDCVRQGHYDYLTSIVEAMEEILEDDLANWIQDKGGWSTLALLVKPPNTAWPWYEISVYAACLTSIAIIVILIFRIIGDSGIL